MIPCVGSPWVVAVICIAVVAVSTTRGAESLVPASRFKTTSTLNGMGEVCALQMLLLLPYQRIKGKEQLEPLWSIS